MTATLETDTLIVGAGAAGLAAALELGAAGRHAIVLEARDRPGGRILTDRAAPASIPVELGAEFVHGESSLLLERIALADDVALDAGGERWTAGTAGPRRADRRHDVLSRVFARLPPPNPDLTFAAYLDAHRRSIPRQVREIARTLVEGFDAADATRISARSVLEEWNGPAAAAAPTFRPSRGYDTLIRAMVRDLRGDTVQLRYDTAVREIRWRRGRVRVQALQYGRDVSVEAKCAIVTLPLGVLQLPASSPHAIRFAPELRGKVRALRALASGPVIKLMMTFSRPFWDELNDGRYREAAFFFAPQAAFPTFWTSLPARSSLLAGWCAGPKAERLADRSTDETIASAIDSLERLFGPLPYATWLERAAWHDWQRDPFARGAYSYVLKGGSGARRALASSIEGTLFFAGEATDTSGEAATVGGALRSGMRAAREVLGTAHTNRRPAARPGRRRLTR
jgi:monoamine oxidase